MTKEERSQILEILREMRANNAAMKADCDRILAQIQELKPLVKGR